MILFRGECPPNRFVLVADELSATTLAELPQDRLAGVVVRDGAANSHAAIMVRALGIPTVMGADIQPSVLHRRTLVVDGYRGELLVDPEPVLLQEYQRLISEENELSKLAEDDVNLPAQLKSGERVKVMLNAGLSPEHEEARQPHRWHWSLPHRNTVHAAKRLPVRRGAGCAVSGHVADV